MSRHNHWLLGSAFTLRTAARVPSGETTVALAHQIPRRMDIDAGTLAKVLDVATPYALSRSRPDGAQAVRDFLAIYEPEVQKAGDVSAAWQVVQTAQDARLAGERAAAESHRRRQKLFYWLARTVQIVASIPVIGAWIVTLVAPVVVLLPLLWLGLVPREDNAWAMFVYGLTTTLWLVYLDQREILKVTMPIPFVQIPAWPFFLVFALSSLSAC